MVSLQRDLVLTVLVEDIIGGDHNVGEGSGNVEEQGVALFGEHGVGA